MRGGARKGAGRPKVPAPLKSKTIRCTDDEYAKIKRFVSLLRNKEVESLYLSYRTEEGKFSDSIK